MNKEQLKKQAAEAALAFIEDDMIVGVGTGSTVNYFIDALATIKGRIDATVSSSAATTERLTAHGITVLELNATGPIPIYIDGADECNSRLELIKGGGGALTREKVIAAASERFICIADQSKRVETLGKFPLPVEVIPMARSYVARELLKRGGQPVWRDGFVTDNGNIILDVYHFTMEEPARLEEELNNITGVITVGIFARRPADVLLLGTDQGVKTIKNGHP